MVTTISTNNKEALAYKQKKDQLIAEVTNKPLEKSTVSLDKKTSNLFRKRQQTERKLNLKSFNKVIAIDPHTLVAEVEGLITYENLVTECLKYSCLPAVVPELKSITVGGALAGGAIESSSFRHGLVHETILEFDVLLSDGQVVTCRPDNEHSDLFFAFPNSYGSLGYALRVRLKMVPAKPFVQLTHFHFTDAETYFRELEKLCHDKNVHFIDGSIFDPQNFYLTLGRFVDEAPKTSDYTYRHIYYRSIAKNKQDYLTAHDYIWRWDTDWFWASKFFYMENSFLRLLFGKWVLNSTTFCKMRNFLNRNRLGKKLIDYLQKNTELVIQDVQIPIQNAASFCQFFQKNIDIRPIWICPTLPQGNEPLFSLYQLKPETIYVNFGFWDVVPSDKENGYYNRWVEDKVRELEGFKGLYSNVYYSEQEFWQIYNKDLYFALKQKYDPQNKLRNLYAKCTEKE